MSKYIYVTTTKFQIPDADGEDPWTDFRLKVRGEYDSNLAIKKEIINVYDRHMCEMLIHSEKYQMTSRVCLNNLVEKQDSV